MIAWIRLRLRARRFGRMREASLLDWWLGEIWTDDDREARKAGLE